MSDWAFDPGRYAGCTPGPFTAAGYLGGQYSQSVTAVSPRGRQIVVARIGSGIKTREPDARLLADSWNLLKEVERLTAEVEQLRSFAMRVMKAWPHGDVDGGELQEAAIECGLLRPETRYVPCGENCCCAENYSFGEFAEGVTCFRRTALLTGGENE